MLSVLVRGGGDLATGVALRLHHSGCRIVITELAQPLAVRRTVAFAEAVYEGEWVVEGVTALRVDSLEEALAVSEKGPVAVLVAPEISHLTVASFDALVDARLTKRAPEVDKTKARLVIGVGPGFVAGQHCHAVVESRRGHTLGRVYWSGTTLPNTGVPEIDPKRVLRSPAEGMLRAHVEIGRHVEAGQAIAEVDGIAVTTQLSGTLRGLIRPGSRVVRGLKVGDVDPRDVGEYCYLASDRALAVGGGVLEALSTPAEQRRY